LLLNVKEKLQIRTEEREEEIHGWEELPSNDASRRKFKLCT
jgi:hypothetical protein